MASYPNRYYNGWCSNEGNTRSHFSKYVIETAHDITDYEGGTVMETITDMEDYYFNDERIDDPYYLIFGILKTEYGKNTKFVAAFDKLHQAITLMEHLSGNKVVESENPVYE